MIDAAIREDRRAFRYLRREMFADRRWSRRLWNVRRFVVQHPRSLLLSLAERRRRDPLQAACLFIGHGRSGSTLVASLLDAHPDIVLGHEMDVLWYVRSGFRRNQIFSLIRRNSRWFTESGRQWEGYSYRVPDQWQGRSERTKIIGDKKASLTAIRLLFAPDLLDRVRKRLGLPLRLVHVIRNPYDNIATLTRRWTPAGEECRQERLRMAIQHYFLSAAVVERMRQRGERIFTLRLEDLVENPRGWLRSLCGFLGVPASPGFLEACAGIVFERPRTTRSRMPWDDELVGLVRRRCRPFPCLRDYTFESDRRDGRAATVGHPTRSDCGPVPA